MDDKMKELIIDYIDGNLNGELEDFVKKRMQKDAGLAAEYQKLKDLSEMMLNASDYEPDSIGRDNFLLAIEEELESMPNKKEKRPTLISWDLAWKVAAAVSLVVISVMISRELETGSREKSQLAELKQEMEETKSLVLSSLKNTTSASARLNGVNVAYEKESVSEEVIQVLIKTMNEDENVNVRLAAVKALAKFSAEPGVTQALVDALGNQKEALVQIALINLMVELKEKGALLRLEKIIEDERTLDAVKDEAHMAVFKLS
ncbi:MAG: HEAT repeat domain-containing protein [Bacteroidota bacterium]